MIEKNLPLYGYNLSVSCQDRANDEIYVLQKDTMFECCETQNKSFQPYEFETKTRCWSFIKVDGELYFVHTSDYESITFFNMKTRTKSEFVFKGITILDVYCPRYVELTINKADRVTFDNGISSNGDEDELDFYSFMKEENKEYRKGESKYTDFFFISGFQRSSGHEAIYLIDLSKYPDIKIIDQKVTKVPYLPLDKSIILVYNGNSIDYSIVCLKNNNIMDLHDEGFIRVYDKAKKIENKECKFLILDVITNIDECLFNNSKKCYSLNYTKTVTEESGINIEFHVLTYQVGDKKFYVQISNNKNFSLWMITNKTTIKSGKINELDYEFVMNYLYK